MTLLELHRIRQGYEITFCFQGPWKDFALHEVHKKLHTRNTGTAIHSLQIIQKVVTFSSALTPREIRAELTKLRALHFADITEPLRITFTQSACTKRLASTHLFATRESDIQKLEVILTTLKLKPKVIEPDSAALLHTLRLSQKTLSPNALYGLLGHVNREPRLLIFKNHEILHEHHLVTTPHASSSDDTSLQNFFGAQPVFPEKIFIFQEALKQSAFLTNHLNIPIETVEPFKNISFVESPPTVLAPFYLPLGLAARVLA
jgi:hypothetical protein